MRKSTAHRGQALAAAVEASGMNKEEAAYKANYSRAAYYKHIENPELPYHIMMAYGQAINHDFTKEFPDMPKYNLVEEGEGPFNNPRNMEEAMLAIHHWKDKYTALLEKHNRLLEEKLNSQSGTDQ